MSISTDITDKSKNNPVRITWVKVTDTLVHGVIPWFLGKGIAPSLRELFYKLVVLVMISNTKSAYKQLSGLLVQLRMNGTIPWSAISDETRLVYFDNLPEYHTPDEYIQRGINYLRNAPKGYRIPLWYDQPNYVEVWIEKLSALGTVAKYLQDRQIRIVPIRGYDGWGDMYKHSQRLEAIRKTGRKCHILYLGDFDPSGEDIDRHIRQGLNFFGLHDIPIIRIAITKEQVKQFNLPEVPKDKKTLDKLDHDRRTTGFIQTHGKLYAVELETLSATDAFEKLIQNSVDKLYNWDIYQELLNRQEHSPEAISEIVNKRVKFLDIESGS